MLSAIGLLFTISMMHCTKAVDPEDLPRIELTAENVASREVWLRVKFININPPWDFSLERDGKLVAGGRMQKADTLVIDTTATPNQVHLYKAIQMEGSVKTLESDALQVKTLDTTSHAVQWQVDTLGVRGTIFDVWTFSVNDIWAVGEIYLKDSTGKEDPVLYNGVHYDGMRWQAVRIPTRIFTGTVVTSILRTIIGFSTSDIWVFSDAGSYSRWNGAQWQTEYVTERQGGGLKFWGASSSNLFLVGTNGSISHYNGTSWRKMGSGTSVDLEDVWGLVSGDRIHVWATGTTSRDGRSVVLYFDGGNWVTLYDNLGKPRELDFAFSTIWTDGPNVQYLAGLTVLTKSNLAMGLFQQQFTGQRYISYRVRGTRGNDIFIAGPGSEVAHFNGSTWYLYPEILALADQFPTAWWPSVHVQEGFVVLGGFFFTGSSGVPAVVRGSR